MLGVTKGTAYGIASGMAAGLIMAGIGYLLPIPMMKDHPPFFVNAIEMWGIPSFVVIGWILHLLTSAVAGGVFGLLATRFATFGVRTPARFVAWGITIGAVMWFFFFLPVEIPPMPMLSSMGDFLAESLGYNIAFGLVLAGLLSFVTRRSATPSTQ